MRRLTLLAVLLAPACASESVEEIPSPDELGKADGESFVIKGKIAYGGTATGRLYGTVTYHGYTFEGLEGATLTVSGSAYRGIAVYGPEDREGAYGPVSQASRSAGTLDGFVLPEDGRYVVIIGKKRGNYSLTLTCSAGCETDAAAGKVAVNMASEDQLRTAGLDEDAILAYRDTYGFAESLDDVGLGARAATLTPHFHAVFFSPKIGEAFGFSDEAQAHQAFVKHAGDAEVDWVPGDVASPVVDLFRRAETEIDVAMYGMSLSTPEGTALVEAAARGVQVKVYLDVSERDPDGNPYTATVIRALLDTPNVEVRVPKYTSKTMHEKFGIVDGKHVFNGSANVSRKARDTYTEDRFVFLSSPAVVATFTVEWNRLWTTLGKDAATIL